MDNSQSDPEALRELAALLAKVDRMRTAHGILMPLAMVLWFPLGVFILRLLKVKKPIMWHAMWQLFGLLLVIAGFGLGIWLSNGGMKWHEPHVIVGIIVTCLFLLMPLAGYLHHRHFAAKGSRDFKRHIHVWGGRLLIVLATLNAGTGLHLAKERAAAKIAYGVIAGAIGVTYVGVWYWKKRQEHRREAEKHGSGAPSTRDVQA